MFVMESMLEVLIGRPYHCVSTILSWYLYMSWCLLVPPFDLLITVAGLRARLSSFASIGMIQLYVVPLSSIMKAMPLQALPTAFFGTFSTAERLA